MEEGFFTSAALFVLQAGALGVLPFVPILLVTRGINALQDARIAWTPYVELAALLVGAAAGVVLLDYNVDTATLSADAIFRSGGPWDHTAVEFLSIRANPSAWMLAPLLPWPFSSGTQTAAGFTIYLLAGLVIYAPLLRFRSPRALANAVRNAVIFVWGAFVTVYGFCYIVWLLNKLNFWSFAVLLVLLTATGSRTRYVVAKLR